MPMDSTGFAGDEELESVIAELIQRPALTGKEHGEGRTVRGDRPLPLICVVGAGRRNVLVPFAERFASTRGLAFARVDAESVHTAAEASEGALPPLPLLTAAREKLELDAFGPYHQPAFDRYRLVEWLTTQRLDRDPGGNRRRRMTELLRRWSGRGPHTANDGSGVAPVVEDVPTLPARTALWLVLTLTGRLGMRVTGVRRQARWLMRQPYAVPAHSRDIQGFAERLTLPHREREDESQVKKLLVHAFLEDLRAAYRRRHRRVLPRRAGLRRTAYTTLLLDNITPENGGWELLQLINDVRNETGEHDPLLVVAAGAGWPDPMPPANHPPAAAELALRTWRENLPLRRQRFDRYARYLWLGATPPPAPVAPPVATRRLRGRPARHRDEEAPTAGTTAAPPRRPANPLTDLRARRPFPPARRGVAEAALALVLLVALAVPAWQVRESWAAGCSYFGARSHDGVSVRVAELGDGDGTQCVGYSDSTAQVFGKNDRLRAAQEAVFAENEKAKRLHAQQPDRAFLTVVHFVGLTNEKTKADTDHASAEELEGLVLRQRQQNIPSEGEPLLRVVVANGGDSMGHAAMVAREMLAPLAADDATVVAVTGMDRTVEQTELAITTLGDVGVPVVGTTLTGTGLAQRSALYFQMVPSNQLQAELVTRYAVHEGAERLILHHPPVDTNDGYVATLVRETETRAAKRGIEVVHGGWDRRPRDVPKLCSEEDRSDEMVFYVGREADFGDYLRQAASGCAGGTEQLPRIVASDSVSRFVAQPDRGTDARLARVAVSYVGLGALVTLAGQECRDGGVPAGAPGGTPLNAFCAGFSELHAERQAAGGDEGRMPWPAERSGVAYDAAGMLVGAVGQLHRLPAEGEPPGPPHRAAVAQHLRDSVFQGATGEIDFTDGRIGDNRGLAVLTLDDIRDVAAQPRCSFLIGSLGEGRDRDPDTGCPR
ncbi:hypothetical protein [Streptomyces spiramenti]|uniref:ABC transporter substrate-binding protein n=1 Tax=Streptomyces spiramenti TaxID=2720606 RepID=A0ABX1AME4_9ACTN|nr:hypothetical protein [Streptomyces spiramenti]NJP66866.1 hypothetical protein [Streptomyces spiramenti]